MYHSVIFNILNFILNLQVKSTNNLVKVNYFQNENVLLVQKYYFDDNLFYTNDFFQEHGIETLAVIDDITIYKTSYGNYKKYMYTIQSLFEIEHDMDINLELPEKKNNINEFKNSNEWFLNRIVNREIVVDDFNKTDCLNQQNVITYIVDTGIDIHHSEFQGRATWGSNFVDDENTDCNMHGTHVAGLVGSKTFGVCKNAKLVAVKVLNCEGSGSYSGVIKGLEWVYKTHKQNKDQKSILNMSLGGRKSSLIDSIIQKIADTKGMFVVVAAGNENADACYSSPAGVLDAMTVMASDIVDSRAYFSNWGSCADIYSPGVNILSVIPNERTRMLSGTSMASPIVAGVMNHYVEQFPELNMKEIKELMLKNSTKNTIKKNLNEKNYLVYLGQ